MSDLYTKFDLAKITGLAVDMPPVYTFLSDITRLLCLDLLSRWPLERWMWLNDSQEITDSQWDEAEALVDQAIQELMSNMLTGTILPFAGSTTPDGFLLCDGQAVSRSDYADLFGVIGTTYGSGNGSITFNLPDLRGRVPTGQDTGQTEFDTLGETGGEKTHTLIPTEMPGHSHSEVTAVAIVVNGGLEAPAASAIPGVGSTGSAGSDGAHNNLQPYLTIRFIIKV
jgi:microcystin-dependent protein